MWSWLFRTTLPGGVSAFEALAGGLKMSQGTGYAQVDPLGTAPDPSSYSRQLYSGPEVLNMQLRLASQVAGLPNAAARALPAIGGAMYQPIRDLAGSIGIPMGGFIGVGAAGTAFGANNIVPFARLVPAPVLGQAAALVGAFALGYGIGEGLKWLWGMLNRPEPPAVSPTGTVTVTQGTGVYTVNTVFFRSQSAQTNGAGVEVAAGQVLVQDGTLVSDGPVAGVRFVGGSHTWQYRTGPGISTTSKPPPATLEFINADGSVARSYNIWSYWWEGTTYYSSTNMTMTESMGLGNVSKDGVDVTPQLDQSVDRKVAPVEVGSAAPQTVPKVAPLIVPVKTPAGTPLPNTQPVWVTRRLLTRTPTRAPATPGTPGAPGVPLVPPGVQSPSKISNGAIVPAPVPKPQPTPNGQVQIGPVTINPSPPRPDLTSIAQELGRIERKMEVVLNPPQSNQPDWLEKLGAIYSLLNSLTDATTYTLGGPCEQDNDGNPIPFGDTLQEWEIDGSLTPFGGIEKRLDAIAEMLQYHKLLRQPSCKGPKNVGSFVTVNFEQIG